MSAMVQEPLLPFANVGVYCRFIVYIFSLYAAYYLFSIRNPSSRRTKSKHSKSLALGDLKRSLSSTDSSTSDSGNATDESNDSPRSCPTLSPDSKSEKDPNDPTSSWHPRRSSPTKKVVRLSCVPFEGPGARTASGLAVHQPSGNLILHGGRNRRSALGDVHLFDSDRLRWSKFDLLPNKIQNPGVQVTTDGIVVIFGGLDTDLTATNALRTIGLFQKDISWTAHDCTQTPWPVARYSHGMCQCGDNAIAVFGGRDGSGLRRDDLWLLDLNSLSENASPETLWTELKPNSPTRPKLRAVPSIAYLEGKIYVFGQSLQTRGEVDFFNMKNCKWEKVVTCGEEPSEQDCHVHALDKAKKLVTVSNKERSSCGMFNRVDILDTLTQPMTWSTVKLSWYGDWTMIPGVRRCFSSAMDTSTGLLYVFGGLDEVREGSTVSPDILDTLIVANFSKHNQPNDEIDD